MKLFGFIAALVFGLAGGSLAVAQHGDHHGDSNGDKMMMSCCTGSTSMCGTGDMSECPGHEAGDDGTCDMSTCCGDMMEDMEDMMGGHSMEGMECGEKEMRKMKCCQKNDRDRRASLMRQAAMMPTLE